MAEAQTVVRKAAGLYSQHNPLSSVPEGALLQAENCVIDREGVLSMRRGFKQYGVALSATADDLFEYKDRLLVRISDEIYYDNDGSGGAWTAWTDVDGDSNIFSPPTGYRSDSIRSNGNFYVTSENGPYKNDELTGNVIAAGIMQGLDIQITGSLTDSAIWLDTSSQIGYKVVWGREDANTNDLLGPPSTMEIYTNTSAATLSTPTLTFSVPDEIQSGDFYEIYRTAPSTGTGVAPTERLRRVERKTITADQITARSVVYEDDDSTAYASLGLPLYTNDTSEGPSQSNDRPPYCRKMAVYEGHAFYFNYRWEHEIIIRLLCTIDLVPNVSAISIRSGGTTLTYTASSAEDIPNKKFKIFTGGATTAEDIRNTAKSLIHVINMDTAQSLCYAYYATSTTDPQVGKILIRLRGFEDDQITLVADSDADTSPYTGALFEPALPSSGNTVASTNKSEPHGVARSKYQQPEAVPRLNTEEFGSKDEEILAVGSLKDATLVMKTDGLFIVTGKTDGASGGTFTYEILDPTIVINASNSAVILDNALYVSTTQGVVRAVAGGSSIVSRQIEPDLLKKFQYGDYSTITFGMGHESERKYFLAVQETSSDSTVPILYVYNYLTSSWTLWRKDVAAGIVLSSDDKLYIADASESAIYVERKDYSTTWEDFQDEHINATITATGTTSEVNGATVATATFDYTGDETVTAGWYIEQGSAGARIVSLTNVDADTWTATLDLYAGVVNGPCKIYKPIEMKVRWVPDAAGNATTLKAFSSCQLFIEKNSARSHKLGFRADHQADEEYVNLIRWPRESGTRISYKWGSFSWGSVPWGATITPFTEEDASTPVYTPVPGKHRRCRAIEVFYQHKVAREPVDILQMALDVRVLSTRTNRRFY